MDSMKLKKRDSLSMNILINGYPSYTISTISPPKFFLSPLKNDGWKTSRLPNYGPFVNNFSGVNSLLNFKGLMGCPPSQVPRISGFCFYPFLKGDPGDPKISQNRRHFLSPKPDIYIYRGSTSYPVTFRFLKIHLFKM